MRVLPGTGPRPELPAFAEPLALPAGSKPMPSGPVAGPTLMPSGPTLTLSGPVGGPAMTPTGHRSRRRRALLVAAGTVAALLLTTGVATGYGYAGDIAPGTEVLGLRIGGQSRSEATEALRRHLDGMAARLSSPVSVRVGDNMLPVRPAEVGLKVDVDATVAAAAAYSPGPLERIFGSRQIPPVVDVDAARLHDVLTAGAGDTGTPMTMPAVIFDGTTPTPVYPKPGRGLDPDSSAAAMRAGWLGERPVTVPLVERRPASTAADVDRMVVELARPAVSAPVTVTVPEGSVVVPPAAIAQSLVIGSDPDGKLAPKVDVAKLRAAVGRQLAAVESPARDATVTISGGRPRVTGDAVGQRLDTEALARDLLAALPRHDARVVPARMVPVQPKVTAAEVAKLGIRERVSTFTTRFSGGLSDPRSQNIVQVAKEVDGAIVMPGEVFSLNGHTGERGYRQGYKDAPVIVEGKLVPGVGGGISQFTTTLFNAAYYAGLEDVEHKPHSYHFSRYPSVIESTIFYPTLDLKFRNNTSYGLLLDTSWTSNSITVSVWSTKVYDSVTTTWSPRRAVTTPKTVYLKPGPDCIETAGINGFTQDAWRVFRDDGKQVRREKFTWTYQAEPRYVCGAPPAAGTASAAAR